MGSRLEGAAEAILLLAVVAAPWPYGCAGDTARYTLAACVLGALGLWAAGRAVSGRGLPALTLPAAGLPALALLQAAVGLSAAPIWTAEAFLLLVAAIGTLVFWSDRARERHAAGRLCAAVLGVCLLQAAFGAVQWSVAPDRVYGQTSPFVTTPFGSYLNHNHFAGLVGMGAVLGAALALGHVRRAGGLTPAAVAFAGVSLALVAAHLASRSRGGLVALTGGIGVLALLWAQMPSRLGRPARRRWIAPVSAAVLMLAFGLMAIPAGTRAHLATLLQGTADLSGAYRVDIAGATVRLAAAHPLAGSGLGAFADAFPAFKRGHGEVRTTHAESDVLEFLAEGGLIGLGLAAWLGWRIGRGFQDRLRHGRDAFRKGMAVGALAAAAALAVHSLIDFNLRLPANALVFCSLLGLAAAPRSEAREWAGRTASGAAAVLFLLLALAAGWRAQGARRLELAARRPAGEQRVVALSRVLSGHPYLAEGFRARGLAWRDLGWGRTGVGAARLERAEKDLRRALSLRPRWAEAWADLGWTVYGKGDVAGARSVFERAVQLDPTHIGLGVSHAEFLARLDGSQRAVP